MADAIIAAKLMVHVNKLGLYANVRIRNMNALCATTCPRQSPSKPILLSSYCTSPTAPALIDGPAGDAMNDDDDEKNVNFEMAHQLAEA
eukprot:8315257-Heterocapsa_arctica.AAC.1